MGDRSLSSWLSGAALLLLVAISLVYLISRDGGRPTAGGGLVALVDTDPDRSAVVDVVQCDFVEPDRFGKSYTVASGTVTNTTEDHVVDTWHVIARWADDDDPSRTHQSILTFGGRLEPGESVTWTFQGDPTADYVERTRRLCGDISVGRTLTAIVNSRTTLE